MSGETASSEGGNVSNTTLEGTLKVTDTGQDEVPAWVFIAGLVVVFLMRCALVCMESLRLNSRTHEGWGENSATQVSPGTRGSPTTIRPVLVPPPTRARPSLNERRSGQLQLEGFYVKGDGRLDSCGICLEPVGDGLATSGECSHVFHTKCITSWLRRDVGQTCPTCRRKFLGD